MQGTVLAETEAFITKQRGALLQQRQEILNQQKALQQQLDEVDAMLHKFDAFEGKATRAGQQTRTRRASGARRGSKRDELLKRFPQMRTVFLTAYDLSGYTERIGADPVFQKPIDWNVLGAAILGQMPEAIATQPGAVNSAVAVPPETVPEVTELEAPPPLGVRVKVTVPSPTVAVVAVTCAVSVTPASPAKPSALSTVVLVFALRTLIWTDLVAVL